MRKLVFVFLLLTVAFFHGVGQDLKVMDYEGLEPHLQKENDTTYVINFWATWCKPCVKEMPAFQKLNREFAGKPFKLLLVSLDFPSQIDSRLTPFIRENNIQAEVVVLDDPDSNAWISKVSKNWSGSLPGTLIYNRNSREFYEKTFEYHELKQIVNKLIKE